MLWGYKWFSFKFLYFQGYVFFDMQFLLPFFSLTNSSKMVWFLILLHLQECQVGGGPKIQVQKSRLLRPKVLQTQKQGMVAKRNQAFLECYEFLKGYFYMYVLIWHIYWIFLLFISPKGIFWHSLPLLQQSILKFYPECFEKYLE